MSVSHYDRAITVFSPDGHLFQVEYAAESVRKGTCAVSICAPNIIVFAVEKKASAKLQLSRTVRKISVIDKHLVLAFAGLVADGRVLINKARMEAQSHRLTVEDPCSVEYMSLYIARTKQKYTQTGGRRPFGVSTLLGGFDTDGTSHLYQTDPAGTYSAWKAASIGRHSQVVREFLEKNYKENLSNDEAIKLCVKSLLEVAESGKMIEVGILRVDQPLTFLSKTEINNLVTIIENETSSSNDKNKNEKTGKK